MQILMQDVITQSSHSNYWHSLLSLLCRTNPEPTQSFVLDDPNILCNCLEFRVLSGSGLYHLISFATPTRAPMHANASRMAAGKCRTQRLPRISPTCSELPSPIGKSRTGRKGQVQPSNQSQTLLWICLQPSNDPVERYTSLIAGTGLFRRVVWLNMLNIYVFM